MTMITEIVNFEVNDKITEKEFIKIVDDLENNYHIKQEGYIDTELLYDKNSCLWIMIQHWESIELMHKASKDMFKDSNAKEFIESIIPETVKMISSIQLQKWTIKK